MHIRQQQKYFTKIVAPSKGSSGTSAALNVVESHNCFKMNGSTTKDLTKNLLRMKINEPKATSNTTCSKSTEQSSTKDGTKQFGGIASKNFDLITHSQYRDGDKVSDYKCAENFMPVTHSNK